MMNCDHFGTNNWKNCIHLFCFIFNIVSLGFKVWGHPPQILLDSLFHIECECWHLLDWGDVQKTDRFIGGNRGMNGMETGQLPLLKLVLPGAC